LVIVFCSFISLIFKFSSASSVGLLFGVIGCCEILPLGDFPQCSLEYDGCRMLFVAFLLVVGLVGDNSSISYVISTGIWSLVVAVGSSVMGV